MKRSVLISLFSVVTLIAVSGIAKAQSSDEEKPHRIDAALEKCLAGKHATIPRAECYSAAEQSWENEVKELYTKTMKTMPAKLLQPLKTNQLAWESYRNSLEQFYAAKSAGQKGTGFIAARIIQNINIWKPRALFLEGLLETYKN